MSPWPFAKHALCSSLRWLRSLLEIGGRLTRMERELCARATEQERRLDRLGGLIAQTSADQRAGFERLRTGLEELERRQNERALDTERDLQARVDDWARHLSGQITDVYAAVSARSGASVR